MKHQQFMKTLGLFGGIGVGVGVLMASPLWTEAWGPNWMWSPAFKQVATAGWYELLHSPSGLFVWLWSMSPIPFVSPNGGDAEPVMNAWIIAIVIQWTGAGCLAGAVVGVQRHRASAALKSTPPATPATPP